jgi:hypothetical protein
MTPRERRNYWLTMVWGGLLTAPVVTGIERAPAHRTSSSGGSSPAGVKSKT